MATQRYGDGITTNITSRLARAIAEFELQARDEYLGRSSSRSEDGPTRHPTEFERWQVFNMENTFNKINPENMGSQTESGLKSPQLARWNSSMSTPFQARHDHPQEASIRQIENYWASIENIIGLLSDFRPLESAPSATEGAARVSQSVIDIIPTHGEVEEEAGRRCHITAVLPLSRGRTLLGGHGDIVTSFSVDITLYKPGFGLIPRLSDIQKIVTRNMGMMKGKQRINVEVKVTYYRFVQANPGLGNTNHGEGDWRFLEKVVDWFAGDGLQMMDYMNNTTQSLLVLLKLTTGMLSDGQRDEVLRLVQLMTAQNVR